MSKKTILDGLVKRHPDGFGFFIPDAKDQPDAFLPKNQMHGLMSLDRVRVRYIPEGGGKFRGEVTDVLSHATKTLVGTLTIEKNRMFIKDPDSAWGSNLEVRENAAKAQDKQLVVAEVSTYPDSPSGFTGKIISILGEPSDAKLDVLRVAYSHQLPIEFSPGARKQAAEFSPQVSDADIKGRIDFRETPLVTIDGATAKDFDDAIFVEKIKLGFRLIVAIADVSHYVLADSPIDRDAYERGTSAYFPNTVIPMLPEVLSNELCSLKPKVARLAMTCEIHYDKTGKKKRVQFGNAVIRSWERLTYGEAQEIIEGKRADHDPRVVQSVLAAEELARILLANRQEAGSLELELPESTITVDAAGEPIDVVSSARLFAHRLIEEMMLAANVAVAEFFVERKFPGVFRVHLPPATEALQQLEKYFKKFGKVAQLSKGMIQKELTRALKNLDGTAVAHTLNVLTLRSMSQAQYKSQNAGHFGLAFEHYTHFTSPIRRYPDLIVHRLLKFELAKRGFRRRKDHLYTEEDLTSQTTWLSACEQRAVKAERQVMSIKRARLMHRHLGEVFEGTISSLTRFGIFVLLRDFDVDGLIKGDYLEERYGEKFIFDEENLIYAGKRSGKKFKLGDPITVQIAAVDVLHGKIDFVFEGSPERRDSRGNERVNHRGGGRGRRSPPKQDHGRRPNPPPQDNSPSAPRTGRFDPEQKMREAFAKRNGGAGGGSAAGGERSPKQDPRGNRKRPNKQFSFRANYNSDPKVVEAAAAPTTTSKRSEGRGRDVSRDEKNSAPNSNSRRRKRRPRR